MLNIRPVDNSVDESSQAEECSVLDAAEETFQTFGYEEGESESSESEPISAEHLTSLHTLRVLVESLISRLRRDVDKLWTKVENPSADLTLEQMCDDIETYIQKRIWGEKESVVSSLVKLTGLLTKIIPMERTIAGLGKDEEANMEAELPLAEEDEMLITRYSKKIE